MCRKGKRHGVITRFAIVCEGGGNLGGYGRRVDSLTQDEGKTWENVTPAGADAVEQSDAH